MFSLPAHINNKNIHALNFTPIRRLFSYCINVVSWLKINNVKLYVSPVEPPYYFCWVNNDHKTGMATERSLRKCSWWIHDLQTALTIFIIVNVMYASKIHISWFRNYFNVHTLLGKRLLEGKLSTKYLSSIIYELFTIQHTILCYTLLYLIIMNMIKYFKCLNNHLSATCFAKTVLQNLTGVYR